VNKYVPSAATPAYLHTDQPARDGIPADNPDRAVEGGNDTTARGYCQVCHTLTNYHRSSNTTLANQCHDGASNDSCGPAEVHCGACHEHAGNFAGGGGSCTGCHSSEQGSIPRPIITTQFDRLTSHVTGGSGVVTPEDCQVCHDQSTHMSGQTIRIFDADDGGVSYSQLTAAASTLATYEGEAYAPACLSCHDSNGASRLTGGVDQTPLSPFTGSAAPPVIDVAAWGTAGHNRPTSANPPPTGTHGPNPVSCLGDGTNGCHGSGHGSEQNSLLAPAAGQTVAMTDFCFNCHDSNGPSDLNIQAMFNGLTYTTTGNNGGGSPINGRHDVIAADQSVSGGVVACADCHQPHVNNDTNPASDPDTGGALGTYSPTGSYTDDGHNWTYNNGTNQDPVNPQGLGGSGRTEPDYINFCLTCHDGTTPPGVTMAPGMINLAAAYPNDHHGRVTGGGAGQGYLKYPWNTNGATSDPATPYAALNCTVCHGPHGGNNIFNLRESITVAGVQMTVGGWTGDTIGTPRASQYADPSTYTLPPMNGRNIDETNGLQEDHYWGAWCSFCHQMESHGQSEDNACRSGHMHGGGAF